jgi:hypothetical protein
VRAVIPTKTETYPHTIGFYIRTECPRMQSVLQNKISEAIISYNCYMHKCSIRRNYRAMSYRKLDKLQKKEVHCVFMETSVEMCIYIYIQHFTTHATCSAWSLTTSIHFPSRVTREEVTSRTTADLFMRLAVFRTGRGGASVVFILRTFTAEFIQSHTR